MQCKCKLHLCYVYDYTAFHLVIHKVLMVRIWGISRRPLYLQYFNVCGPLSLPSAFLPNWIYCRRTTDTRDMSVCPSFQGSPPKVGKGGGRKEGLPPKLSRGLSPSLSFEEKPQIKACVSRPKVQGPPNIQGSRIRLVRGLVKFVPAH